MFKCVFVNLHVVSEPGIILLCACANSVYQALFHGLAANKA